MQKLARKEFLKALFICALVATPVVMLARTGMLAALWLPLGLILFLIGFPILSVKTAAKSLLMGLFDLDLSPNRRWPIRMFFLTLGAYCVGVTGYAGLRLMLLAGPERFGIDCLHIADWVAGLLNYGASMGAKIRVLGILDGLAAWVALFAITVSYRQDKENRPLGRMLAGVVLALATADACTVGFFYLIKGFAEGIVRDLQSSWIVAWLGVGYEGKFLTFHVEAALAAFLTLGLYVGLGFFGRHALGKQSTVAAVMGPIMIAMIVGWVGMALIFWLGRWNTPVLLVLIVWAVLSKYFHGADHTYEMVPHSGMEMASPSTVLSVGGRERAILVAAAGGGIQAAAWTAQVLKGLHDDAEVGLLFDKALCALSGISGGSMGSACYVHWLANPAVARDPVAAASDSSLDEVAWGLAWPDLVRVFVPTLVAKWPDRGGAMEHAWAGNASNNQEPDSSPLWNAISSQYEQVKNGDLPALLMGSTIVDTGSPLILNNSRVKGAGTKRASDGWIEGEELHREGPTQMDIPIVRGARLSATFPYVSATARPRVANLQPHMMDGGFFDNYGMATLTEWLDQALEQQEVKGPESGRVERVLLIQVNGFPTDNKEPPNGDASHQGWPYQLIAPVLALAGVRTAGQKSHRDIESALLRQKWEKRGVEIEESIFECNYDEAPLSWHLMPQQKAAIAAAWAGAFDKPDSSVLEQVRQVRKFLTKP